MRIIDGREEFLGIEDFPWILHDHQIVQVMNDIIPSWAHSGSWYYRQDGKETGDLY